MVKFKINNHTWSIRLVTYQEDACICGETDYIHNIIDISDDLNRAQMKSTITHELTHAFRWSYGFESDVEYEKVSNAWIEEMIANFVESFGSSIVTLSDKLYLKLEKEING